MKIAIFVPFWPQSVRANGIVTYATHLIPALRRAGHDVYVLTFHVMSKDVDPYTIDLNTYRVNRPLLIRALARIAPNLLGFYEVTRPIVAAIQDLCCRCGVEVAEIEETFGLGYAISRLRQLPLVVRMHGPWFLTGRTAYDAANSLASRRRIRDEGRAIADADFVTAPSRYVLDSVKSYYGISLEKSKPVANPLDATESAARWNLDRCDVHRLLFVGRFDESKGGDLVLSAFSKLAAIFPSLKLTFVGPDRGITGLDGQLMMFNEYARGVLSESVLARVEFRGALTSAEVSELRTQHFATICASRMENFPYTVLEAMASGSPVVATDVGGIPEIITSGRNGLLFPLQDASGLALACQTLLEDHQLAARLGAQAWQDCRERYNSDSIAQQTIAVYQTATKNFASNG